MLQARYNINHHEYKDKTRILALTSGSNFGATKSDDHMLERLNAIMGNLDNPDVVERYQNIRNIDFPDSTRERLNDRVTPADLMYNDCFRQHCEISERFRKNLIGIHDLRKIGDGSTRFHISISRGYERYLVDYITRLDSETIDRISLSNNIN